MLRKLLIVWFALLAVASCSSDDCGSAKDCPADMSCVYYDGRMQCFTPCTYQYTCPTGLTCSDGARSCDGCEDIVLVCI